MAKSDDVTQYMDLLDVEEEVFSLGMELALDGFTEQTDKVLKYSGYHNASYVFLELVFPDRSVVPPKKGSLRLLNHRRFKGRDMPKISEKITSYIRMTYLDQDINIDPELIAYAEQNKLGKLTKRKITLCTIILPKRGAVTFEFF